MWRPDSRSKNPPAAFPNRRVPTLRSLTWGNRPVREEFKPRIDANGETEASVFWAGKNSRQNHDISQIPPDFYSPFGGSGTDSTGGTGAGSGVGVGAGAGKVSVVGVTAGTGVVLGSASGSITVGIAPSGGNPLGSSGGSGSPIPVPVPGRGG